jgi:hypothetical protein
MLARSLRNMPFLREWENPVSEWQEAVEIEGLTLYDIHRAPRKPVRGACSMACAHKQ